MEVLYFTTIASTENKIENKTNRNENLTGYRDEHKLISASSRRAFLACLKAMSLNFRAEPTSLSVAVGDVLSFVWCPGLHFPIINWPLYSLRLKGVYRENSQPAQT